MRFQAIEKPTLVERVEERLLETIQQNNLSVGDSLPPELELTEKLGVSRSVVREALSRLRMLGVLDSRKKRGMVVAEPDIFGGCKQVLDTSLRHRAAEQDLFEMRPILEMGLADLLFRRKTAQDLEALEAIVEKEEKASSESVRIKLEIEFHTMLYRIGRNHLLLRFQGLLESFFREAMKMGGPTAGLKESVSHRDLLDELRQGTAEGLSIKMSIHMRPPIDRLPKIRKQEADA
jgi:DNA-binding FadR family transcriptional regulator